MKFFSAPFLNLFIKHAKWIGGLLLLLVGRHGWADNIPAKAEDPQEETFEQELIEDDIELSEWFSGVANGLDLFLVSKKITDKPNETHVKLQNSSFALEGQGANNTDNISVALRLPNVEEYWQLKFSSYDEQQDQRNIESGYLNQTPKTQNYGASLGFFRMVGDIRTAFQPRIILQNPLKISHSLSFETVAETSLFRVNPRWELFADPVKGTGTDIALNVTFGISKKTNLIFLNTAEYDEAQHLFTTGDGFSFGQVINRKSSLAYSLIFNSNNMGNYHLENYSLGVTYNRLIHRGILDIQIIPHWDFTILNSFRGAPGLVFNLNITF